MNEPRLTEIAAALSKLLAVRAALTDVSSDIDVLHDAEVDAERDMEHDDVFSAVAEETLLSAYEKSAEALEALDIAIDEITKASKVALGDYASMIFPELNDE